MKTLFILCGVPGSGKSTWASKQFGEENVVSRDKIRFSFLDNESDYFDKETFVWEEFIREIQNRLNGNEEIVVADATHINKRSRNKLLNALKLSNEVNVIPIFLIFARLYVWSVIASVRAELTCRSRLFAAWGISLRFLDSRSPHVIRRFGV